MTAVRPLGPRTLADRAALAARAEPELRRVLAEGEAGRVLLLVPDPHARFAAVELGARFVLDEVLSAGYGLCSYVFAWDPHRDVPASVPDGPLARYVTGFGDVRMLPDLATVTRLPDRTVAVVCDVEWPGGGAVAAAPRTALTAALAALERHGLVPSAGIEHEVTFTDAAGTPLTGQPVDYAVGGTEPVRALTRELAGVLDAAGLEVESARAECHPGQFESVLRHRDPLAACDDAMLQQLLVREAAARHGVRASYLAAQDTGLGSSCHVHLSLSTMDGSRAGMEAFLAGVLRDAAALTAVWAPTWNSYVRLRTAPFSPRVLRWGTDDRTAAVRLAGRDGARRLEFRFAGADAQPHLVVAALLAAGLAGIDDGLSPPPEGEVTGELAATPWRALELLRHGRLAGLLGEEVAAQQEALLAAEIDAGLAAVTDWQRSRGALRS
ncbi:glutamine synthetase [Amycolatopsis suaedae]|uniref:glutamine synthetase n=1 Tax=Amycolatopsis suaedae TaxID=2510978 RepID=UPI00267CDF50